MRIVTQFVVLAVVLAAAATCGYAQTEEQGKAAGETSEIADGTPQDGAGSAAATEGEQKEGEATDQEKPAQKSKGFLGGMGLPIIMVGAVVLMLVWSGRGRRKQEAQRREMLASLKKGDKVTSVGGIVGTVIEVRDDEVSVKVDETNNVRMHFARWAIRGVGDSAKIQAPGDKR